MNAKSILTSIARIEKAIDHFVGTFARCVCRRPELSTHLQQDGNPLLSAAETHRIRRALWRIEVCCELARSGLLPGNSNVAGPCDRVLRLMSFLKQLNPWEIEELHCVYEHLENLLHRDFHNPLLDSSGKVVNPYALPLPIFFPIATGHTGHSVDTERLSHGLVSLHHYLRCTPIRSRANDRSSRCDSKIDFIACVIHHLKDKQQRFPEVNELKVSSRTCLWTDNHGTNIANIGWRFFTDTSARGLHFFAHLRKFGFCIWDEQHLRS